jgi:hypothetical protein
MRLSSVIRGDDRGIVTKEESLQKKLSYIMKELVTYSLLT